jgi:hypothetical protein
MDEENLSVETKGDWAFHYGVHDHDQTKEEEDKMMDAYQQQLFDIDMIAFPSKSKWEPCEADIEALNNQLDYSTEYNGEDYRDYVDHSYFNNNYNNTQNTDNSDEKSMNNNDNCSTFFKPIPVNPNDIMFDKIVNIIPYYRAHCYYESKLKKIGLRETILPQKNTQFYAIVESHRKKYQFKLGTKICFCFVCGECDINVPEFIDFYICDKCMFEMNKWFTFDNTAGNNKDESMIINCFENVLPQVIEEYKLKMVNDKYPLQITYYQIVWKYIFWILFEALYYLNPEFYKNRGKLFFEYCPNGNKDTCHVELKCDECLLGKQVVSPIYYAAQLGIYHTHFLFCFLFLLLDTMNPYKNKFCFCCFLIFCKLFSIKIE